MDTDSPLSRRLGRAAMLTLAAALLILLFGRGLMDPDEGRYAEIPREMAASGNWMEMRLLGYRYYEKPPLAYWFTAPPIAVFGARDWAARIPLAFNLAGMIWLFYRLMRREWPPGHSRWTLLLGAASLGFTAGFTLVMTDPFLALFFSLTCYLGYFWFLTPAADAGRGARLAAAAGASAALGFLTKGAVAIVLPGAILLAWAAWERRLRQLRFSLFAWSGAVFLALAGSALLLIERHNPGFFRHFIWHEHIARFTGTRELQGHPEPFWFFAYIIPLFLAPWTLFLPRAARMMAERRAPQTDRLTRLLLVWSGVVVIFFSASTGKLMSYVLPAMMPVLILAGRWGIVEPFDGTTADRRLIRLGIAGTLLAMLALVGAWIVSYANILPNEIERVRGVSVLALLPLAICGWPALRRLRAGPGFQPPLALLNAGILLTAALMLTPLPGRCFNVTAHKNSSVVYQALAQQLAPDDRIISFWSYRPSLAFYTRRIYRPYQNRNEMLFGMRMEPGRPADMQHPDEVRKLADGAPGRVYALVDPDHFAERFRELGLNYRETDLPRDPRSLVLEILP